MSKTHVTIPGAWKVAALLVGLFLGLVVVPTIATGQTQGYEPPHQRPGPAAERIQFRAINVDIAPASIRAGDIDFYAFGLKTEAARLLKGIVGVRVYEAPATSLSLVLNPAPAPKGELNPFSIKEVRQAIQYVVDRRFIAQEIYKGQARPMVAPVGPADFDYLAVYDLVQESGITYDTALAKEMVTRAMTQAGATLQDGKWSFGGKPITLKFIVRVEDERRDIGDLVRVEMEKLGFSVTPVYHQFAPAILTVYGSDPQLLQWHLYTEGWGRGAAERYDFATINQMAAPWLGNMPGWQEVGFWQYENKELDDLGQRLFRGDFKSQEERNQLYREIVKRAQDDSVRIWLATVVNSLPVRDNVRGVTEDVTAGPKSIWTLRDAYVPGRDTLTVGNLWVWTERTTWNPVGGFGDVYSVDIWRNLQDPPLWRDPFTGIPVPFRATYQVTTAGPSGKLDVPADAFVWDAKAGAWTSVASGTRATSKVVFDYSQYLQSKWHDGEPITMADILYGIFQGFDLAFNEDKARVEFAIAHTSRPSLETFRGFRVVGDDKLEVYVDFWHFLPDYIAEYASPTGLGMPWPVLAAMDRLVFQERRAAYSDTAAQRFGVPWISLVMDRDSRLVRRTLLDMRDSGQFPTAVFQVGGRTWETRDSAVKRYDAVLAWFAKYGTMVISNGPFKLVRYDPPAQFAEIEAFRDPSYPFKPGHWYRGSPPTIQVQALQAGRISVGAPVALDLRLQGSGSLGARYTLLDAVTGKGVASGTADQVSGGQFRVQIPASVTAKLAPGPYRLLVVAFSDATSSLAERQVDLEVGTEAPALTPSPGGPVAQPTPTPAPGSERRGGFGCRRG